MDWDISKREQFVIPTTKVGSEDTIKPFMFRITSDTGYTYKDLTFIFDRLTPDGGGNSIPNRKKLAFTQIYEGKEILLCAELDVWDHTNEEAIFWVRPENLSSTYDNLFFLYYDINHEDNPLISEVHERAESFFMDVGQAGSTDINGAFPSSIVKVDGIYHFWYHGHDGSNWLLHHCQSTSLDTLSGHQVVISNSENPSITSTHPGSVIFENNTYKMWYGGYSDKWRVWYSESSDGINWPSHQMVIDTGNISGYNEQSICCAVIKEDNKYRMWYSVRDDSPISYIVAHCDSDDGIIWNNHTAVITDFDGRLHTGNPYGRVSTVTFNNGVYYMVMESYDSTEAAWRLLSATSTDGYVWENFKFVTELNLVGGYDTAHNIFCTILQEDQKYTYLYGGNNATWRILRGDSASLEKIVTPSQYVWFDYTMVHHLNSSYNYMDSTANKLDIDSLVNAVPVTTDLGTPAIELTTTRSYIVKNDSSLLDFTDSMGLTIHAQFDEGKVITSKRLTPYIGWGLMYSDQTISNDEDFNDDFNGADGEQPSISRWFSYGTDLPIIQNNELYFASSYGNGSRGRYWLNGNFDIEVGYKIYDGPAIDAWQMGIRIRLANGYIFQCLRVYSGRHYEGGSYYTGSWHGVGSYDTTKTEGRLRVTRVGYVFYGYRHDGNGWVLIGSWSNSTYAGEDIYVEIHQGMWSNSPYVASSITDFKINSGNLIYDIRTIEDSYVFSAVNSTSTSNVPIITPFRTDWTTWNVSIKDEEGAALSVFVEDTPELSTILSNSLSTNDHSLLIGDNYDGVKGVVSEYWMSDNADTSTGARFLEKMFKDNVIKISTNFIQGYATVYGRAVETTILAYHAETYQLIGHTTSSATTGYYYMEVTTADECFVVALDGGFYNHHILGKIIPQ